ncbi:TlpA family protein disulfide reductase [Shewanella sp. ENK2]|uniref:TlpA family protein disulfide reductase n=1 Tax=Shewanella sp. ENK2 TaxID=2775245 RepID=UPI0037482CA9
MNVIDIHHNGDHIKLAKWLLFAAAVIQGVLLSSLAWGADEQGDKGYQFPKAADFALFDANGKQWSLESTVGKPVVIHFWATWCPYCKKLQPGLERLRQTYQDTDLEMIAISFREDKGAQPQSVLKSRGIEMQTLINGDSVADLYGVKSTPTTVFINRSGEVVWVTQVSDPDSPKLAQAIEYILTP